MKIDLVCTEIHM